MEFALLSLGDLTRDPHSGRFEVSDARKHHNMVELGVLAERTGFDAVWLGEHHFGQYVLAVPQMVLAAIGARTSRIRLGTGVTLLPNHDPVRIAEDFATLDCLTNGRAELSVGVGITPDTYAQFGQKWEDQRAMLREKVDLLQRLWTQEDLHWSGQFRAPLAGVTLTPRPVQRPHPTIWYGGGRSTESAQLAVEFGLPIMLPSVFAHPGRFREPAQVYRKLWAAGRPGQKVRVGAVTHCHVRSDGRDAAAFWQPYFVGYADWVADLCKLPKPPGGYRVDLNGPLIFGDVDAAVARILEYDELLEGLDLLAVAFDGGGMPHDQAMAAAELFGTRVIPAVRAALAKRRAA